MKMTIHELNAHITSCAELQQRAYADFNALGDPDDRAKAVEFTHRMTDAIKTRNALIVARGEAIERIEVEQNKDFFSAAACVDSMGVR